MSDKMIIVGKDGEVRYIVEDDKVTDQLNHKHIFDEEDICIRCNKSKEEIETNKESDNESSTLK